MSYEEKIMVAAGDASHEDEVKLETKHRAPGGHVYDLEPSDDKSELVFKEDGTVKDTIPVNTNFSGTRARWNALTASEKAKYLTMDFTDDEGNGDISDKAITYTSSDVTDGNANSWTVVTPIRTGLSLNTLFSRVSQMFKNVRYLYKTLIDETTISTTEKYIGTYNGSSLYRKLIELSYAASSGSPHTQSLSNYGITGSNVKRMYGYAEGDGNYGSVLTFPCYYGSNAFIQAYILKSSNTLYIINGTQYNNNPLKIHLIVEYTK